MAKTVQTGLIRSFAAVMAIAFVVIGLLLFLRHKPEFLLALVFGVLFYAIGLIRPQWLAPVYVIWMKFAMILSWVNTRILLCIIFYGVLTPVSLAMKLFRFDPLARAFDRHKASYWETRETKAFVKSDYERLY